MTLYTHRDIIFKLLCYKTLGFLLTMHGIHTWTNALLDKVVCLALTPINPYVYKLVLKTCICSYSMDGNSKNFKDLDCRL